MSQPASLIPNEIHERIKKGYIERLLDRQKKMRRLLAERQWQELKTECSHIRDTAQTFGFQNLSQLAQSVEQEIPDHDISRAHHFPKAHSAADHLFLEIDALLALKN